MESSNYLDHLFHFDGILHWCFLVAVIFFPAGVIWVIVRVLIPLRRLATQAIEITTGDFPTFEKPIRGIKEIEQLRQSLQFMGEQIRIARQREAAYRNAITEGQENERMRIAREIHDDTIQSLVLVAHSIERASQTKSNGDAVAEHLENARSQLINTIDSLRQMMANLRPTILDELGLAAAIEVLCEKYPLLKFSVVGDSYSIDPARELAIFRAAQETIYNAERHAKAEHISATLTYSKSTVTLEVQDDGVGFQIPRQLQEFSVRGHYGLIGIRERIVHLGGQIKLHSVVTAGTRITVSVPS